MVSFNKVTLDTVCDVLNGDRGINYPSSSDLVLYGIPFINAGAIENRKINFKKVDFITESKYNSLSGAKFEKGDIVFCLRGSLGKYAMLKIGRGAPASSLAVLRCKSNSLNNKFLFQLLGSEIIEKQILSENNGSSQPNLSAESVKRFLIPLPGITEQIAISGTLSDVDSLIFSLQKLIEKRKAIKQGAMQELLTGKKRLPGFSGEWEKNTLKQICEFINGRAYSQHELLSRGKYKVLRLGNLFTNSHWYYTDLELNEKQYCEKGDLLYAWSASFGPTIWDGEKSVFHYHIWKIKCSEMIDKKYLYHFLNADVSSILNELQGGTMFHLTKENMENRLCSYPNLDEQQAIAQVLSDMDCEIEQLEKKLAKYQQIKQGMMQELLTGRIRITNY